MVLAILTSSLTESVLGQMINYTTSAQLWSLLETVFTAQSSAQAVHLRLQLASLKKGGDSITIYFKKAKAIVSSLTAAGQALPNNEFVIYVLAGLGPEYESLVTSLSTQPSLPGPIQLFSHLLHQEERITPAQALLPTPPSANVTTNQTQRPPNPNSSNQNPETGSQSDRGRLFACLWLYKIPEVTLNLLNKFITRILSISSPLFFCHQCFGCFILRTSTVFSFSVLVMTP